MFEMLESIANELNEVLACVLVELVDEVDGSAGVGSEEDMLLALRTACSIACTALAAIEDCASCARMESISEARTEEVRIGKWPYLGHNDTTLYCPSRWPENNTKKGSDHESKLVDTRPQL